MGRVVISRTDETPLGTFPHLTGVTSQGDIKTRGVVDKPDRPVFLWMHELAPGAEVRWDSPPVGHVAFVWSGDVEANGTKVPTDGVLVVEHKANAVLRAGAGGATVAHFHRREDHPEKPNRAGGNVHVLDSDGIFKVENAKIGATQTLYADGSCDTCQVWLHRSNATRPRPQQGGSHFHTEDEIIVVRGGSMVIGRRTLPPGTALAIDADTIYSFAVPEEGLEIINFRANDPSFVMVGKKNEPLHAPLSDREVMRNPHLLPFSAKA